jgi:hypothetical protein
LASKRNKLHEGGIGFPAIPWATLLGVVRTAQKVGDVQEYLT